MRRLDCFGYDDNIALQLISDKDVGCWALIFLGQLADERILQQVGLLQPGVESARRPERTVGRQFNSIGATVLQQWLLAEIWMTFDLWRQQSDGSE